ncbi:hypothetical protein DOJK_00492 [Patescibacteria group bacterium]|nr:hypothetical protein DOJK_00492 [Patescibacteria group bacterium]
MNLADFHFIRPYWLIAILPAIMIIRLLLNKKLSQGSWANYCDTELLPFLLQEHTGKQHRWYLILGSICTLLIILALAGPTWQRLPAPVFRNESALVIALNLNASMDAADVKPNRLTMARYKIADILKQRKDGQTALVVYSDEAFTVTPLTNDTNTINSLLDALTTDIMPNTGNNIAIALEKSTALLKQSGLQTGQILLITDSADDTGLSAAKNLEKYQLSVLGVGTESGAPIALDGGGFLKDSQGSIVVSKLDAEHLSKLANAGNGVYQTITADDTDVQNLTSGFDNPIRQKGSQKTDIQLDQWEEQGIWLLCLVLPLGALFFRRGLLVVGLVLLLPFPNDSYAFDWKNLWQNQDQQAYSAYQQKNYKTAAEKFTDSNWQAAARYQAGDYENALKAYQSQTEKTADNWYNQGNTLAQLGKTPEAIAAYQKALELNPNDEDAKYNKELLEKEQEKQQQEQQQQQNQQKDSKKTEQNAKEQQKQDKQQKTEQEQQQQQNAEQQENEQAPEKKAEKTQKELEQQEEAKKKAEQQQAKEEKPQQQQKQEGEKTEKPMPKPSVKDENQQANEQWLNRIPDDPAGLLRRKFKYQYGQQR